MTPRDTGDTIPAVAEPSAPTAVHLFDLDAPADLTLGAVRDGRSYRAVLVIVRRGGRPIGSVVLPAPEPVLRAADVHAAALAVLGDGPTTSEPLHAAGPLVSVVVTTCGAAQELRRCLDSLMASRYRPFEVIVVENRPGPESPTRAVTASYGSEVRYVEEPTPGLSRARNAGLAVARGTRVAFTDDDVVVDPDWLPSLVAALDDAPDVVAATGLILPLALDTDAQLLLERFASFGKGFAPATHRLAEGRARTPLFPYTAGELGSGASIAIRTDVLRALGGFDVTLGAGTPAQGGEDLDLLIRVVLAGHALRYEPRALLWHDHPDGMERLSAQVRSYGVGLAAMASKHLLDGSERGYLLRQLPRAVRYLLNPASRKNQQKGPDFPRRLVQSERMGMLRGPLAYVRSRREASRTDAAIAAFEPVWVTEVDLAGDLPDLDAPARAGRPYPRARVLIRRGGEPLGFVEAALEPGGRLPADVLRSTIDEQLAGQDGATPSPVTVPTEAAATVTVVISTRDRARSLRVALETLLASDYDAFEVVVVDNAARTDATAHVVRELDDPRVRMLSEPVPGLSRARNTGAAAATGEIIAFTDDDVLVDRLWLRSLVRGFRRAAHVGVVTGMVPSAEIETPAQAYFDAKVGWADSCEPRLFDLDHHRIDAPLYPYVAGSFGAGANFAVSRSALKDLGPFDEALGAGSPAKGGEDIDYFLRAILAGYAIAYEPAAVVWHVHRRELTALRGQMDGYGSGLSAFAFKHLLEPRTAIDVLRRVPSGLVRMRELRDRGTSHGDPLRLWRPELGGFARGPARYLRGRRAGRRR